MKKVKERMQELFLATGVKATAPYGNPHEPGWGVEMVSGWGRVAVIQPSIPDDALSTALIERAKEIGHEWHPTTIIEGVCDGPRCPLGFRMKIAGGRVYSFVARASMLAEMWSK